MSFQFNAVGMPEEVIGQLMEADTGKDTLGEAVRDLLLEHLHFPGTAGPGSRYVFAISVAGSSSEHAIPTLHIESEVIWVPYVHAGTAEKARQHVQRGRPVPEGD